MIKNRDELKAKFNKLKDKNIVNYDLFENYKRIKNQIYIELRQLRKQWFENRVNECRNDSKKLWNIISEVTQTKTSEKLNQQIPKFDVNLMNNYFIETPIKLSEKFENNLILSDLSSINDINFSLPFTTDTEVQTIISKIDNKKSCGFDNISPKLLKMSTVLVPIITILINSSFLQLSVPKDWKIAAVKALFKSGQKSVLSNYRPISILPIICKIMERLVYNKLFDYVIDNKLLSES